MGFSLQEKRCVSNGNICAKRMVNNLVNSFHSINSSVIQVNNHTTTNLFNHLRSWQRSRKMKIFNNNNNNNHNHNHKNSLHSLSMNHPINNLCYQSVSISSNPDNDHTSHNLMKNEQRNYLSNYRTTKSTPFVSFKNKGDGKIALNMRNHHQPIASAVILNENQLYSMDLMPRRNAFHLDSMNEEKPSTEFNDGGGACYASLEPPNEPKILLDPNDPLNAEQWYYGCIDREQAIRLVQNCPTGSFVVRKSSSMNGCYALTVRVPHDYNHNGVSHYLILKTDASKFKIKGFNKEFPTISSLITHHSIMKEQLPCTLRLIIQQYQLKANNINTLIPDTNNNSSKSQQSYYATYNSSQVNNNNNINDNNNKNRKQSINYSVYNTAYHHHSNINISSCQTNNSNNNYNNTDHDRMVDIDLDPTYQRILENFRKVMAHCN